MSKMVKCNSVTCRRCCTSMSGHLIPHMESEFWVGGPCTVRVCYVGEDHEGNPARCVPVELEEKEGGK